MKTVEILEKIILKKLEKDSKIKEFNKIIEIDKDNNKIEKEAETIYLSENLKNITIPLSSRKALD